MCKVRIRSGFSFLKCCSTKKITTEIQNNIKIANSFFFHNRCSILPHHCGVGKTKLMDFRTLNPHEYLSLYDVIRHCIASALAITLYCNVITVLPIADIDATFTIYILHIKQFIFNSNTNS